jgi:hypothetical protein
MWSGCTHVAVQTKEQPHHPMPHLGQQEGFPLLHLEYEVHLNMTFDESVLGPLVLQPGNRLLCGCTTKMPS